MPNLYKRTHAELLNAKSYRSDGSEMLNGYKKLHSGGYKIYSAKDSMYMLRPFFPHFEFERVVVCGLDRKLNVVSARQLFSGGPESVDANPNMIAHSLLCDLATYYVLCHNHPEGHSLSPSDKDKEFTKLCDKACRREGLIMLDHMIICEDRFWSFRRNGAMPRLDPSDVCDDARGLLSWREKTVWFGAKRVGDIIW